MKTKSLVFAVATATLFSGSVMAADGTITFNGAITDQTCTVTPGDKNKTVVLGTVGTSAFAVAGDKAPTIFFNIGLTDCPNAVTKVQINFDAIQDTTNPTLIAIPAVQGAAEGVGLQITDRRSNTVIVPGTYSGDFPIVNQTGTIALAAGYVATAIPVVAGTANTTSNFTIGYN